MREFINIWESANISKKVFHGTSIEALAGILVDGNVNASEPDDYDTGHTGVSLTSSLAVADKFAREAKDRDWDNQWNSPVDDRAILVFDGPAIQREIGSKSVTWDGSSSEREHRTHGPIPNVMRFIVQIIINPNALGWWITAFGDNDEPGMADALKRIPSSIIKPLL